MKLGITGAVNFTDYERFKSIVQAIPAPITMLVTGGLSGTEKMARRYAKEQHLPILIHHAKETPSSMKWLAQRNILLANDSDNILAFNFPGTYSVDTIRQAARLTNKRCNVIFLEGLPEETKPYSIAARYGEEI